MEKIYNVQKEDEQFDIYCPDCQERALIKTGGSIGEVDVVFLYCICSFKDKDKCAVFNPDDFSSRLHEIIDNWKKETKNGDEEILKPKDGYQVKLIYKTKPIKVKEPNPAACLSPPP